MIKLKYAEVISGGLVEKLKREGIYHRLLPVLMSVEDTIQKVKIVEEMWMKSNINPALEKRRDKNNTKARSFRNLGHEQYTTGTISGLLRSIESYNKSIAHATIDSEDLAIGYGNRAAVYFELYFYDMALININMALDTGHYPEQLKGELLKRKEKCINLIEQDKQGKRDDNDDNVTGEGTSYDRSIEIKREEAAKKYIDDTKRLLVAKLSYPANPKVPFLIDCLEMRESDEFGRCIMTTRALKPGDIVAIEDPFCEKMAAEMRYVRCEYCLREEYRSLIPCDKCTAVMYCSESCRSNAYNDYHRYECSTIDYLYDMFSTSELCAIRAVLHATTLFPSFIDFIDYLRDVDRNENIFTIDHTKAPEYVRKFLPVHSLVPSKEKEKTIFNNLLVTCFVYNTLLDATDLGLMINDEPHIRTFVELIYRHILAVANNASGMTTLSNILQDDENSTTETTDDFASGIYPFRGLLNHSCAPNVLCASSGRKMVVSVLKPIPAGGQLFDNYLYVFFFLYQICLKALKNYDFCLVFFFFRIFITAMITSVVRSLNVVKDLIVSNVNALPVKTIIQFLSDHFLPIYRTS